jgi:hypothetical protein
MLQMLGWRFHAEASRISVSTPPQSKATVSYLAHPGKATAGNPSRRRNLKFSEHAQSGRPNV